MEAADKPEAFLNIKVFRDELESENYGFSVTAQITR